MQLNADWMETITATATQLKWNWKFHKMHKFLHYAISTNVRLLWIVTVRRNSRRNFTFRQPSEKEKGGRGVYHFELIDGNNTLNHVWNCECVVVSCKSRCMWFSVLFSVLVCNAVEMPAAATRFLSRKISLQNMTYNFSLSFLIKFWCHLS